MKQIGKYLSVNLAWDQIRSRDENGFVSLTSQNNTHKQTQGNLGEISVVKFTFNGNTDILYHTIQQFLRQ